MKSILKETVSFFQWSGNSVRIWRGFHEDSAPYPHMVTIGDAMEILDKQTVKARVDDDGSLVDKVCMGILDLPDVNAVEIRDLHDQGIVYYKDWP
jgi:hypothetical protein